jgi:hypothetical protein
MVSAVSSIEAKPVATHVLAANLSAAATVTQRRPGVHAKATALGPQRAEIVAGYALSFLTVGRWGCAGVVATAAILRIGGEVVTATRRAMRRSFVCLAAGNARPSLADLFADDSTVAAVQRIVVGIGARAVTDDAIRARARITVAIDAMGVFYGTCRVAGSTVERIGIEIRAKSAAV